MSEKCESFVIAAACGHEMRLSGSLPAFHVKHGEDTDFEGLMCTPCWWGRELRKVGLDVGHLGDVRNIDWDRPIPTKCQKCGDEVPVPTDKVQEHEGCPRCRLPKTE